jgi:MFS family permease
VQRENTNLLHKEIHEGLVWFWRQKNIRFLNSIYAGVTIVAVGLYLLIIIIAKNYHASSATIGVILGLGAVGGVLGSIVAPYLHKAFQFRTLLMITMVGLTLTFGLYFFAFNIVLLAIITACMNFIAPSFDVVISSFTTPLIPDEIRGRISSITRLTTFAAYSLGFFLMGVSIQFLGVTKTIATFFVFLIVLSLFVITNKSLKQI